MKKPLFALLLIAAVAAAGFGLYHTFTTFNRSANKDGLKPKVVIYTYSSFLDSFGPGPMIKSIFEKECLCTVEFVDVGSGSLLIERLKMVPDQQVDLVIGLDQLNLKRAVENVPWKVIKAVPQDWEDIAKASTYPMFIPLDYAPMTFVYRDGEAPAQAKSFDEWTKAVPRKSIALQEPSLSSPGLEFLYWMFSLAKQDAKGDLTARIASLAPSIHSVSPEWSGSYSLFQSGSAKAVFTYVTSLVYHEVEQKKTNFRAASFSEGHPVQIEYVGIPEQCISCGLAEAFVNILMRPDVQKIIMEKNYMLPVVKGVSKGTPFEALPQLKMLPSTDMDQFSDQQKTLLETWKTAIR